MLGWIHEKMATPKSAPRGGKFSVFGSTTIGKGASTWNNPCTLGKDCSTAVRNSSWDNAHTFDPFSKGKRLGKKPSTLVQHAQHIGGSLGG
jgi:hypothetical protein